MDASSDLFFLHAAELLAAEHDSAAARARLIAKLVRAWFENGDKRNRNEISESVRIELSALYSYQEDVAEAMMNIDGFLSGEKE